MAGSDRSPRSRDTGGKVLKDGASSWAAGQS